MVHIVAQTTAGDARIEARPEGGPVYIFLDVDGVLNSLRSAVAFQSARQFDPVAIGLLDRLCVKLVDAGYEPRVVISSTWRMLHPRLRWWADLWAHHECIAIKTVGCTPEGCNGHRGSQVREWLAANKVEAPYVCLDDDGDFLPGQPLVQTSYLTGLQLQHIDEAYRALTGEPMPGLPRILGVRSEATITDGDAVPGAGTATEGMIT